MDLDLKPIKNNLLHAGIDMGKSCNHKNLWFPCKNFITLVFHFVEGILARFNLYLQEKKVVKQFRAMQKKDP